MPARRAPRPSPVPDLQAILNAYLAAFHAEQDARPEPAAAGRGGRR